LPNSETGDQEASGLTNMEYPTVKRVEGLGGLKAQNGSFLLKTVREGDKTVQNNKKPLFSPLS